LITLKEPYPQFLYWLAMTFFSAVPFEVEQWLLNHNSSLHQQPFGSGAFQMVENKPFYRMVLQRFANYNQQNQQSSSLGNIEQVIYWKEKEVASYWRKFLQGYYEFSGIPTDFIDQVLNFKNNQWQLKPHLLQKNMNLQQVVEPSVYYLLLNQKPKHKNQVIPSSVKDAIWYGIDREAYIQFFLQGKGKPAYDLIPPQIAGHGVLKQSEIDTENAKNIENKKDKTVLNSVLKVKKIMEKAGYSTTKPFNLIFDVTTMNQTQLQWFKKQLSQFHIKLEIRVQDWNRLQERMLKGDFQMTLMGWNADYPDAENFWFLLDGTNQAIQTGGENKSNYNNEVFNQLFTRLKAMPLLVQQNEVQQQEYFEVLKQLAIIFNRDKPIIPLYYPTTMTLSHGWVSPFNVMTMGANDLKYRFIDVIKREEMQRK
jgi:oligopeptide transport system substrate-binding protein